MKAILLLGSSLLLTACMSYDEARVGPLGSTVQAVHYQQIADPVLAANPGEQIPPALDGPLTERVVKGYREASGDAKQVSEPIQIRFER
ncbi:hypothetical protein [Pseudomonas oligotrophica]|uniref:hypothetical protein n=1 Tax=Pseudomonas oligotrophica TaxID=2912055 RepID=UPI001F4274B2|nr:hypothetical protein [Pseudomonas oligotrophica]MCF7202877.1 hypothetical protein [Pseudomonas oligotrophica]